jgi:hypothetical protein
MTSLEDYAKASELAAFHLENLKAFTPAQRQTAEEMIPKLVAAGCEDPLSWVISEVQEGIAQTARFGVLREMFTATQRAPNLLDEIGADDEQFQAIHEQIRDVVSDANLEYFTRALCKSFGFDFLMILDDCQQADGMPSWGLKEFDASGNETGRFISGLHEDYEDFSLREAGMNHE